MITGTAAVMYVAWRRERHGNPIVASAATDKARPEGRYDIRRGTAGYAPIIGTFGALAVPAIIVLFTVPTPAQPHMVALAAGLLIVAMIASITGAIGMAAIGAEQDPTANLVPATMFLAVAVAVSLVSVLAAFEVLAAMYLPHSETLFAVITGSAGLLGAYFTALSIADSWHTGPTDPAEKNRWLTTQWIKSQEVAEKQTLMVLAVGAIPALAGIAMRVFGAHLGLTPAIATWLVAAALALALGAVTIGAFRTRHPVDGRQKGLRRREAYGTTMAISVYTLAMMIFLP